MNKSISLNQVQVGYENHESLIKIPSLELKRGQFVGLVGVNGCGKSTLIRSIASFQDVMIGDILIDGKPIEELSAASFAKKVSVVLTDKVIMGYSSVFDVVATGRFPYMNAFSKLSKEDVSKINEALQLVGMLDKSLQAFDQLSDGQQQKVILAKCLAQETPFILLDEPMAFLDLPSKMELSYILHDLAKNNNKGIIISTHDLDLAMHTCDTMWLVNDKKIIAGAPEDLALRGLFSEVFDTSSVLFNKLTGHFEFAIKNKGFVAIESNNSMEVFWLRKMLHRIGFGVQINAETKIKRVKEKWIIESNATEKTASNFEELISLLV